jgi:acetyl-CoA C-acetyltransferase
MGITAENVAKAQGVTREMQDTLALASQQKAAAAQAAGKF